MKTINLLLSLLLLAACPSDFGGEVETDSGTRPWPELMIKVGDVITTTTSTTGP